MKATRLDIAPDGFLKRTRGRPPTPELREKELRSAQRLFAEKQFHQVLTDEIAAGAG